MERKGKVLAATWGRGCPDAAPPHCRAICTTFPRPWQWIAGARRQMQREERKGRSWPARLLLRRAALRVGGRAAGPSERRGRRGEDCGSGQQGRGVLLTKADAEVVLAPERVRAQLGRDGGTAMPRAFSLNRLLSPPAAEGQRDASGGERGAAALEAVRAGLRVPGHDVRSVPAGLPLQPHRLQRAAARGNAGPECRVTGCCLR